MKLVYLTTGQQAYLVEELSNGKFIVEPLVTVQDHNGDYDLKQPPILVDKVFNKPPTEKICKELKDLQDKVYEERKKLNEITKEYNDFSFKLCRERKEQDDLSKWKIDLSRFKCAKEIAFFMPDKYLPVTLKHARYQSDRDVRLKFEVSVYDGKTIDWQVSANYQGDDRYWSSKNIDENYGFIYDISPEELESITIDRINKMDFSSVSYSHSMLELPEKYRTDAWIKRYDELVKKESEKQIESCKKQIEEYKEKLKKHEQKFKDLS